MKILWIKTDFLHPTNRGGQIRSLEILRWLHRWHEVDYLTLDTGGDAEGPARANEYCRRYFVTPHQVAAQGSPAFYWDLCKGLFDSLPLAVSRWRNARMGVLAMELNRQERYDAIVCDFLAPAASLENWPSMTLFQHNVEALLWDRHAERGKTALHRWYLRREARKMASFEAKASRRFGKVITVSREDAEQTRSRYGREGVQWTPTGVDIDYFAPPEKSKPVSDLVFVGSMDWLPNVQGALWFNEKILPLVWKERPETTVSLVGRKPLPEVIALGGDARVSVSGTVDDVRPWMHGSKISIVPLQIGGGTRLKIYEAMAAGVPTVSTRIGAEGLDVEHEKNIVLADSAEEFARACLDLLEQPERHSRLRQAALEHVRRNCGWEQVARKFGEFLKPS
jgi:glycosyltransferase involved in cell wall biosynthesis